MKEEIPELIARHAPCKKCGRITKQIIALYNPRDPNGGEVWQCTICNSNTEWVKKLKHRK